MLSMSVGQVSERSGDDLSSDASRTEDDLDHPFVLSSGRRDGDGATGSEIGAGTLAVRS